MHETQIIVCIKKKYNQKFLTKMILLNASSRKFPSNASQSNTTTHVLHNSQLHVHVLVLQDHHCATTKNIRKEAENTDTVCIYIYIKSKLFLRFNIIKL